MKSILESLYNSLLSPPENEHPHSVNVNEKVYHLTLNLFTTLTAN